MKRLLTALLALLGLLGAPACFAIGPYLAGTAMPAGELPALMAQLEQKLRADGFNVVGRHLPRGLPQQGSIVVTDASCSMRCVPPEGRRSWRRRSASA